MKVEIGTPKSRKLYFTSQVNQDSISKLTQEMMALLEEDEITKKYWKTYYDQEYIPKPIEIYIDSYGGMVYQCFGLMSLIETSPTPIHTIVTGCAMSCGFMMLISGHKRFAMRLSTPLYHQVSTGFSGNLEDMEISVEESRRLQGIIEEETLKRTKITKKKLKNIRETKTDWFMDAETALKLGVVDEIIT